MSAEQAPKEGGSYTRNADGSLLRIEHTVPAGMAAAEEPLPVDIAYALTKNKAKATDEVQQ